VKAAVLDDADKLPGIAFGVSFWWAGHFGEPVSIEALAAKRNCG
jgi:hypothetical protein